MTWVWIRLLLVHGIALSNSCGRFDPYTVIDVARDTVTSALLASGYCRRASTEHAGEEFQALDQQVLLSHHFERTGRMLVRLYDQPTGNSRWYHECSQCLRKDLKY